MILHIKSAANNTKENKNITNLINFRSYDLF